MSDEKSIIKRIKNIQESLEIVLSPSYKTESHDDLNKHLSQLMNIPDVRKAAILIANKKELDEQENRNLQQAETSVRMTDIEKVFLKMKREMTILDRKLLSNNRRMSEMENKFKLLFEKVRNHENELFKSESIFYNRLYEEFHKIEEIRLFYIQEEYKIVHVTVCYDESIDNYTEIELRIFDIFEEVSRGYKRQKAEILVLVHEDSLKIPENAKIHFHK